MSEMFQHTGIETTVIQQIIQTVLQHLNADKIVLFGSRARGDFSPTSDIDIAVYTRNPTLNGLYSILNEDIRTLKKIDVIHFNKVPLAFQQSIEKEGIVLYEKKKS